MEYSKLLSELREIKSDEPFIIAIDGAAGSGKTTLAQKLLKDLSDVQVIHMDDLYEGWSDPLSPKLAERVTSQIFQPFMMQLPVNYQCFNWKLNRFDVMKSIQQSKYLIIEGTQGNAAQDRKALLVAPACEVHKAYAGETLENQPPQLVDH